MDRIANNKILYLCADRGIPFAGTKGASIHVREFLEALKAQNYAPTVAVARRAETSRYEPDYPVHMLPNHPSLSFLDGADEPDRQVLKEAKDYYRNEDVQRFLTQLHRSNKFGLIYERYSLFATAGCMFAQSTNLPFVLEVNAPLVMEASRYRQLSQMPLARSVEQYLFTNADHIISVSERLRDYIVEVVPEARVTVVPNGVSLENFESETDVISWRNKLTGKPDEAFIIGFVGSVKPWHGVDLLMETTSQLVNMDSTYSMCVVGTGDEDYESQLHKQCSELNLSDNLSFTGAVAFEDIPHVLKSMDVLVAPYPDLSHFYFSPLKLFEYMAAGKPIIASDIGQIASLLQHEKTALLVPPGNPEAMADAIRRLRNDTDLAQSLSMNALNEVRINHTWRRRLDTVVGIFNDLQSKTSTTSKVGHADTH